MSPLLVNVPSADMYLLDNISIRICLEFAAGQSVINIDSLPLKPKLKID